MVAASFGVGFSLSSEYDKIHFSYQHFTWLMDMICDVFQYRVMDSSRPKFDHNSLRINKKPDQPSRVNVDPNYKPPLGWYQNPFFIT